MVDSLSTASPRQVKKFIIRCILKGRVPYIQSSPGMGKSSIVREIAQEYNLELIDHRLSTSTPEDLTGLPTFINGKAVFAPFDIFPTEDTPVPPGKDGWILFLDEFNSAPKSVQAAAYKLVLDFAVGNHKLHSRVRIVCAGNLATDRAIVNPLSTAMQSRLIHLEMSLNHSEWMEDVAFKQKYDPRIIAYLNYKPNQLMDFRPDHNDKTFCCPRTWEFMNDLIRNEEIKEEDAPLYSGTITSGAAVDFIQFVKVFNNLPKMNEILADPKGTKIPGDAPTRFAVSCYLIEKTTENEFGKVSEYINRFPIEFRVIFYRGMMNQNDNIRHHPAFQNAIIEVQRYLYG